MEGKGVYYLAKGERVEGDTKKNKLIKSTAIDAKNGRIFYSIGTPII